MRRTTHDQSRTGARPVRMPRILPGVELGFFELDEDLSFGSPADGCVLLWDDSEEEWVRDETDDEVPDANTVPIHVSYSLLGAGHAGAPEGARVWAVHSPASGRWELLAPTEIFLMGELAESLSEGGSADVSVSGMDDDIIAHDPFGSFSGEPGDNVLVRWNGIAGRWEIIQLECS